MEEQNSNWRDNVSDSASATLKILDGEEKTFEFLNEGAPNVHPDYGSSVVFLVKHEEEEKKWYVKENNYALLNQIKVLGVLKGKHAKASRVGSTKSNTRYTLEEVPTEQTE